MKSIAFYFFAAAVLCATIGMAWGIQMSISGDHTLSMAHAHLNLVGWTTLGLFGLYYSVTPGADGTMLSKAHLAVAILGLICFIPGIVIVISNGARALVGTGSILTVISMLIFLVTVAKNGIGRKAA